MSDSRPPASPSDIRRHYEDDTARQAASSAQPGPETRDWQSLIEEQIAKIDFANLPGKGRPLDLSTNAYASPEDEMAHRLLKNAGFTLPWIAEGQEIDQALARARQQLQRAWERYAELRDAQICAGHQWIEGEWEQAKREFKQQVEQINRQIRDYNLKTPTPALHRLSIHTDEELARLGVAD